ncbi:MAG: RNA-binding protein [Nitrospirae bacterium CG_4_9_14_3_um_filter_53_35]|nr:MAG: RNA-binding protein [Nitrospirae bacterium CG2_30_53_67]PIS38369.1 MAG: RNA-binding protein [Nitrospirae bacterium CG08_land_8_20_14_0_20_52_24]PIV82636.1 MAG: RNA-binding protein [Nitrospirae bacterium CG17_big_fil_post_rev_8_21_14_2_50_50_9]PIW84330.1 MAG: RNA-binding protein [Nitrospirae bacterium CG_4_8_14_3_um_filter_50_41]PIX86017.1 MAG: RNA-binding protein [Nitrospirae bacterium CG_4_10_14_3_um_filter_53_41]PJA73071.1 MAG: RNA-binding protein [Nitrospirae bacterium CG_4_9_14_3_u
MSMKLYVGNLSYEMSESQLSDLFTPFGAIESAKIITDKYTGNSKGFGFVEMSSREEGEKAISELNGKQINNRAITVNEARPKPERGSSGGRGGGGGGGRGRY